MFDLDFFLWSRRALFFAFALLLWSVEIVCGCEGSRSPVPFDNSDPADDDSEGGDDSQEVDDDDVDDDDNNNDTDDADSDTTDTEICSEFALEIEAVPTRMMVLQDLSNSMNDGSPPKWDQAKSAITSMLSAFDSKIELGFDVFPKGEINDINDLLNACKIDDPLVADCLPSNGQAIIDQINSLSPFGATPLFMAMKKFTEPGYAPNFQSEEFKSYLLIVSDGGDTCGQNGDILNPDEATPEELGNLSAELLSAHEVYTFAVGFGQGVSPEQLNAIAQNGGTPFDTYIEAQDQQALEEAFDAIAAVAVGCEFEIAEQDEDQVDLDKVKFYFDGEEVPWDPDCTFEKGWTWLNDEHTEVKFCKEACEKLKNGEVTEISATFGCPPDPVVE